MLGQKERGQETIDSEQSVSRQADHITVTLDPPFGDELI